MATSTVGSSTAPSPAGPAPPPLADHPRQGAFDAVLRRHQYRQDALIEILHAAQQLFGYLSREVLWYVARQLRLPLSRVYGVASFYHLFALEPPGTHTVVICRGTVCHMHGIANVAAALRDAFGVAEGESTPDGRLTVTTARCVGISGLAPAVMLDGEVLPRVVPEAVVQRVRTALAAPPRQGQPPQGGAQP